MKKAQEAALKFYPKLFSERNGYSLSKEDRRISFEYGFVEGVKTTSRWFINLVGVFCHYAFFTDKLWKKVKGFENKDEAEVIAAFLHLWMYYEFDVQDIPRGSAFASNCETVSDKMTNWFEEYFEEWKPVYVAYSEWCMSQR